MLFPPSEYNGGTTHLKPEVHFHDISGDPEQRPHLYGSLLQVLSHLQRHGLQNTIPGPGAKGIGTGFIRNYQKWQELCVNMDTICENKPVDTSYDFFGKKVVLPVFAAPVGAMQLHYGDKYDDLTYNDILVTACAAAGIAAFTGDGINPAVMEGAAEALKKNNGCGVPTVKPWNMALVEEKWRWPRPPIPSPSPWTSTRRACRS